MQTIHWGIIGCGDVTEVKSGPAFNKVPHSKLVAVMRRNAAKAEDYAHRHGVPKWYSSADELIHDPEVNAIYIATPPSLHLPYTLQALAAGKPVYVEKPMALNGAEARQMADAANTDGAKLCVAHYRRQWPLFKKVKALLEEGAVGKIKSVIINMNQPYQSSITAQTETPWRLDAAVSGGGLFHDLAPHQLDLLYYFFGAPLYVSGAATNKGGFYAADDTVDAQMHFAGGIEMTGHWNFVAPESERLDECVVEGEQGRLTFSFFSGNTIVLTTDKEQRFDFDPLPHVQQPMIEKVVRYFLGDGPNPCTAEEGVAVMEMIDAVTAKDTNLR